MTNRSLLDALVAALPPLERSPGRRLPLLLWPAMDPGFSAEAEARDAIQKLADRGVALISTWDADCRDGCRERCLRAARIQRDLGLMVCVNATPALAGFFNGEESTAHLTDTGEPFFDRSFDPAIPMGCPFRLEERSLEIRSRVESWADAYVSAGVRVDLAFADWEIDGPLEWNGAWVASRRCRVCRQRIAGIEDFSRFQDAIRAERSRLQRLAYAEPLLSRFLGILVGNYGVYPNDGWRYWYDWYERFVDGAPHRHDGRARHRRWPQEFPLTGYTMAMPVVYPWKPSYWWHDHPDPDFRWFRAMLLAGSNAPHSSPVSLPIVPFVHWRPIDVPGHEDPSAVPMSREAYTDLLWHLLLRGCDTFFLWCAAADAANEIAPVHEVYASSFEFSPFIEEGVPVCFEVPDEPGPVVSALRLRDRLLVRRTDFGPKGSGAVDRPVRIEVDGQPVRIPPAAGVCQVIPLD